MIERQVFYLQFKGQKIPVSLGVTIRQALMDAGISPHNGQATWLNCKGMGTCGTCAVEIIGKATPPTAMEKWRLQFPPHKKGTQLRLACQCKPLSDCKLIKHEGFWGELDQ
jgi:ferredoxin